jgi:hypothetical protein
MIAMTGKDAPAAYAMRTTTIARAFSFKVIRTRACTMICCTIHVSSSPRRNTHAQAVSIALGSQLRLIALSAASPTKVAPHRCSVEAQHVGHVPYLPVWL